MAWTEQCKIAFHANAEGLLGKQKRPNVRGVIRELSKDSGVPQATLLRWYYSVKKEFEFKANHTANTRSINNDTHDIDNGNNTLPEQLSKNPENYSEIMCSRCKNRPVEIDTHNKKPYSKASQYYGLCQTCRKYQTSAKSADKSADEKTGILTVCPYCEKSHYVLKSRIGELK
ncbi:MAG: hypothetical protein GY774_35490 [Planctomycetes bacterium]|nr:hypothetical protein [Planctomycetota bacterium]